MEIKSLVKVISGFIVSMGVGAIVGNTIKLTTPQSIGLAKKISIGIGGLVLSSMIGDYTSKYADKKIDETAEEIKKLVDDTKNGESKVEEAEDDA
jgi:hypothetical protein